MNVTFVIPLLQLRLPFIGGRGDRIRGDLRITTDPSYIGELVPEWARGMIGSLEYNNLVSCPVVHASATIPGEFDAPATTLRYLRETTAFLQSIWLHVDNAVYTELGFLIWDGPEKGVHSNFMGVVPHLSDGSTPILELNREQFGEVRESFSVRFDTEITWTDPSSAIMLKGTHRVARALYWIQAARCAGDVGERIANFCSALEALFATTTSELAHQLAERSACFTEAAPLDRLRVYREIKKAYAYRSKIVHGDVVKPADVAEMLRIARICDDILRRSILKIMGDGHTKSVFGDTQDALDRYLLDLIFGVSTEDVRTVQDGPADP